ncbi:hypothetical protein EB796_013193 [Bugula neritina]|uniref:Uncharacterized protein n=1 Tax=Bugula neritina TaxID=10212 RepID=A0A7J7JR73_BUGNE|nr:hypothetical protein EB796_013193 [Bugula neritina]
MCASLVIYLDAVLNGYDFHRIGPIFTPYIAIFHQLILGILALLISKVPRMLAKYILLGIYISVALAGTICAYYRYYSNEPPMSLKEQIFNTDWLILQIAGTSFLLTTILVVKTFAKAVWRIRRESRHPVEAVHNISLATIHDS